MRAAALLLLFAPALAYGDAPPIDAAQIDTVMKPWTHRDGPGCAVGVVQHGKLAFAKGYGMADLERHVPITADTVFDIASMSKQFTAMTVAMLVTANKLKLDDDVRAYLPELPALAPITLREMLHHTSGLRDYVALLQLVNTDIADVTGDARALAAITRQRGLDFAPGTAWSYSNTNYFLLAQIVARVSKQPFPRFVHDRIFQPLGMTHSVIHDDHTALVPDRALGYARGKDASWGLEMSNWEQSGDGNILTTLGDLARWDANWESAAVGGKAARALVLERGKLANGDPATDDYAGGLMYEMHRGQETIGHDGSWAGYRSAMIRFPGLASTVIVMCNAADAEAWDLAFEVADAVLDAQLGPRAVAAAAKPTKPPAKPAVKPPGAAELAAYAGRYHSDELDVDWTLSVEGGVLIIRASGDRGAVTWSAHDEAAVSDWSVAMHFARGAAGVTGFAMDAGHTHGIRFVRAAT